MQTWIVSQGTGDNGLVLDRIKGTGRVNDAALGREQLHRALEDAEL